MMLFTMVFVWLMPIQSFTDNTLVLTIVSLFRRRICDGIVRTRKLQSQVCSDVIHDGLRMVNADTIIY